MLGSFMARISTAAGLSRRYTNHSLHSTCISILDRSGFEARDICNISGNRSECSLKSYIGLLCDSKKQKLLDASSTTLGLGETQGPVVKKKKEEKKPACIDKAPPTTSVKPRARPTSATLSTCQAVSSTSTATVSEPVEPDDPDINFDLGSPILMDSQLALLDDLDREMSQIENIPDIIENRLVASVPRPAPAVPTCTSLNITSAQHTVWSFRFSNGSVSYDPKDVS